MRFPLRKNYDGNLKKNKNRLLGNILRLANYFTLSHQTKFVGVSANCVEINSSLLHVYHFCKQPCVLVSCHFSTEKYRYQIFGCNVSAFCLSTFLQCFFIDIMSSLVCLKNT